MSPGPPIAARAAALALALLALATALGGAGAVLLLAPVALFDPTLAGDWTLGVGVAIALGSLWGVGVLGYAVSGLGVWSGVPALRTVGTGLAVLALFSPLFLLGVVALWGRWGDEEGRAWFVVEPIEPLWRSEPDPVQGVRPPHGQVGEGEGGAGRDPANDGTQQLASGVVLEEPAEPQGEQVEDRSGES